MSSRFVDALRVAGLDLTAREIADAMWLATYVTQDIAGGHDRGGDEKSGEPGSAVAASSSDPPASEPRSDAAGVAAGPVEEEGWGRGSPERLPTVRPMASTRALLRAMQPLRQRLPVGRSVVLDERETVARSAALRIWHPVLRPEPERWLDLIVAVDAAPTMAMWRPTVQTLINAVHRFGGFRQVSIRSIDSSSAGPLLMRPRLTVRPGVLLVISDGVGRAWRDGRMQRSLGAWARTGCVAFLDVLPHWMWSGTGVRVHPAVAYSGTPGAPAARWIVRTSSRTPSDEPICAPIPVLELHPRYFGPWSRIVAGRHLWSSVSLLASAAQSTDRADGETPATLVARYRGNVNQSAFDLAVRLSAVQPLTIPLMQLVQVGALPSSSPADLSAVLLGGLLQRVDFDERTGPTYDFRAGVRNELKASLNRADALQVLRTVGAYLTDTSRTRFDVAAAFSRGGLAGDPQHPALRPLALVASDLLELMGIAPPSPVEPADGRSWTTDIAVNRTAFAVAADGERVVGVADALSRLSARLADPAGPAVISIVGPGGTGKTTLARTLVLEYAKSLGFDRVAWTTLRGAAAAAERDEADWRDHLVDIARQLGLRLPASVVMTDLPSALRRLGGTTRCVIVIDNVETSAELRRALMYFTRTDVLEVHRLVITTRVSVVRLAVSAFEYRWNGLDVRAARDLVTHLAGRWARRLSSAELDDIVAASDGNPLMMHLLVGRLALAERPMENLTASRAAPFAETVNDKLIALSLSALRDRVGETVAARIVNALCTMSPGSAMTSEEWLRRSGVEPDRFVEARDLAQQLALAIRGRDQRFAVHALIRQFAVDDGPDAAS